MEFYESIQHAGDEISAGHAIGRPRALNRVPGGNVRYVAVLPKLSRPPLVTTARGQKDAQEALQVGAHFAAIDDRVNHAVSQEKFGRMRALRQLGANDLLRHARAGKADQGARLGDHDIAQIGKRGEDTAGGRVREDRDEKAAVFPQALHGGGCFRHLQE